MKAIIKRILLLYKKSAYRIYFLERQGSMKHVDKALFREQMEHFKKAHDEHYRTLQSVKSALEAHPGLKVDRRGRGQRVNYANYELIITVGGDGTFLEAARHSDRQLLLGVNSAPSYSRGSFCIASAENFSSVLQRLLEGNYKVNLLHRLRVRLHSGRSETQTVSNDVLNDILVCHENPAMLSRYVIGINGKSEDQKSSGLWIASASGSSGAIYSAGGRRLERTDRRIQYKPRELYPRNGHHRLRGGTLQSGQAVHVTSLMRQGAIYLDGAHLKLPFTYGSTVTVTLSPNPIKTVALR